MNIWDAYQERINAHGGTKRGAALQREIRRINNRLPDNLSYHTVTVDDVEQNVAVINSDNLNEKSIISMPGEDLVNGGLVHWMDNYWLITERDANMTVYTKCKMIQCNHLLKWVSEDGVIHEQWCIVEDGTKYLTGEFENRDFIATRGDSRIAVTIARNSQTINLNRKNRFLIDDPETKHKLAYTLSKPLKLGGVFNNQGVYKFVLQEVSATDDDNHELGIADYYKYFPRVEYNPDTSDGDTDSGQKKRWL